MKFLTLLALCFSLNLFAVEKVATKAVTKPLAKDKLVNLVMNTNYGEIYLELNETKAPITVKNFLAYVEKGHFKDVIFHRVIKGFMIQGGGFDDTMKQKATLAAIKNEATNGLKNEAGTIAMARTPNKHSATSQFFINVGNNESLNHTGDNNYGYAVFGRVVKGMPVVKKIEMVKTTRKNGRDDVPVETVKILKVKLL